MLTSTAMGIEEVTVSVPSNKKTMKTCNKCLKCVKVHVACFKCHNVYHAKCFLKVPTIYINEKGHIFCCQNITSKYDSFQSKLQTQENKNGRSVQKGVCGSDDGLENSRHEQEEHEKDEHLHDARFEKKEILKKLNRDKVGFVCCTCGGKYLEEKSYRWHIKSCENNHLRLNKMQDVDEKLKKMYKCDECSYMSKYRVNVKRHSAIHSTEKSLRCTFKYCKCSQSAGTSQVKHCDCSMCEYRTNSKRNLGKHIMRIHIIKERKYKCNYCSYSTLRQTKLTEHKCANRKQFKCATCKFKTIHKYSLTLHIQLKHSNVEKKFKSNDCESSFHMKQHLKRHMSIHSNEKPFKCDKCEYTTALKHSLSYHISAKHNSGGKNLTCGICGFVTACKLNFQRHIYRHSKEKC